MKSGQIRIRHAAKMILILLLKYSYYVVNRNFFINGATQQINITQTIFHTMLNIYEICVTDSQFHMTDLHIHVTDSRVSESVTD